MIRSRFDSWPSLYFKRREKMQKIVINKCYGGFGLSDKEIAKYQELTGLEEKDFYHRDIPRDAPFLVQLIEESEPRVRFPYEDSLKKGFIFSDLKVVEIPDGVDWIIQEYDGIEWVAEKHRTWE